MLLLGLKLFNLRETYESLSLFMTKPTDQLRREISRTLCYESGEREYLVSFGVVEGKESEERGIQPPPLFVCFSTCW